MQCVIGAKLAAAAVMMVVTGVCGNSSYVVVVAVVVRESQVITRHTLSVRYHARETAPRTF